MNLSKTILFIIIFTIPFNILAQSNYSDEIDALVQKMTLEEKIGQLNHLKGNYSTDIYEQNVVLEKEITEGNVGAISPQAPISQLIEWQKMAVEKSRLKIPLIFSGDIIHGHTTLFPIPLGQSCSWDLAEIKSADSIAAVEASASGINWTFAPMLDLCRDPRWGRNMETSGEDAYLTSRIGEARILGFQGNNLGENNTILACAKHFAGYGAVEAGLDYNLVDMSERHLREYHLRPFKAAIDQGVATVMNAFNTLNGIPASSHDLLLKTILKKEWKFEGFTVSDANSFYELIPHGVAIDKREAAIKAFKAGSDTDLWGQIYTSQLPELVKAGIVDEREIDSAVRKVLKYKFELGLFDDPYMYLDEERQKKLLNAAGHREFSRRLAGKSFVLLENKNSLLPLDLQKYKKIALIGPMNDSRQFRDLVGNWGGFVKPEQTTTIVDAFENRIAPKTDYQNVTGCGDWGQCSDAQMEEAVGVLKDADIGIVVLGENGYSSGESASKTDISLPGNQEELIKRLKATGKPIVLLVLSGRPLVLTEIKNEVDAMMVCWQPGTEAGNAIVDVLLGKVNPSGKLTMTMPYHQGQVPIYYNRMNTGRPRSGPDDKRWGVTRYADNPTDPLYAFGYGLSYTTFDISKPVLSASKISMEEKLEVTVEVTNTGDRAGAEVIQLYIRDMVASVSRPLKELKKFERLELLPNQTKNVSFSISAEDLKYWNDEMKFVADPGEFKIFVGNASDNTTETGFWLE